MADSIRKRILIEMRRRLALVTIANGFTTDAGAELFTGALPALGPSDPDAVIAIVPQDLSPSFQTHHVVGDWPIDVVAVANASGNREEPWLVVEDVLADIQRAMELEDRTFAGLVSLNRGFQVGTTRTFGRDSGTDVVAVSQLYTFELCRVWGHPEVRR